MELFKRINPLILAGVGIVSSSILAYLSISSDQEISFRRVPKRLIQHLAGKNEFKQFLSEKLKDLPSSNFCENPSDIFQKISLEDSAFTPLMTSEFWNQKLPSIEQEAVRRCQKRDAGLTELICLSWSSKTPNKNGGFLSSKELMIELYVNFHHPQSLEMISCHEASQLESSLLSIYYTLYWVEPATNEHPTPRFQRFTDGLAVTPRSSQHEIY